MEEWVSYLIAILVTIVISYFLKTSSEEGNIREELLVRLETMGYEVDTTTDYYTKISQIIANKIGSSLRIRSWINNNEKYFQVKAKIDDLYSPVFYLYNRNYYDGNNIDGDLPGMDQHYIVETADHNGVIKYLSRPDFTEFFNRLLSYNVNKFIIASDNKTLELKIEIPMEFELLILLIQDFNILEPSKTKVELVTKIEVATDTTKMSYKCYNCKEELDFNGDICPFCNTTAPHCVICFNEPNPNDFLSYLSCCQSFAHSNHLKTYLKIKNQCPYCKRKSPIVLDVIEKILGVTHNL